MRFIMSLYLTVLLFHGYSPDIAPASVNTVLVCADPDAICSFFLQDIIYTGKVAVFERIPVYNTRRIRCFFIADSDLIFHSSIYFSKFKDQLVIFQTCCINNRFSRTYFISFLCRSCKITGSCNDSDISCSNLVLFHLGFLYK